MELILLLTVVGLIVLLSFLKTKLPDKWQLIVTSLAGLIVLSWLWGFENGETHWKILITVVVAGSVYNLIRKLRLSKHNEDNPITN